MAPFQWKRRRRRLTIFYCVGLLFISSTVLQKVVVAAEDPLLTKTTFDIHSVETINGLRERKITNYFGTTIKSSGLESAIPGNGTAVETTSGFQPPQRELSPKSTDRRRRLNQLLRPIDKLSNDEKRVEQKLSGMTETDRVLLLVQLDKLNSVTEFVATLRKALDTSAGAVYFNTELGAIETKRVLEVLSRPAMTPTPVASSFTALAPKLFPLLLFVEENAHQIPILLDVLEIQNLLQFVPENGAFHLFDSFRHLAELTTLGESSFELAWQLLSKLGITETDAVLRIFSHEGKTARWYGHGVQWWIETGLGNNGRSKLIKLFKLAKGQEHLIPEMLIQHRLSGLTSSEKTELLGIVNEIKNVTAVVAEITAVVAEIGRATKGKSELQTELGSDKTKRLLQLLVKPATKTTTFVATNYAAAAPKLFPLFAFIDAQKVAPKESLNTFWEALFAQKVAPKESLNSVEKKVAPKESLNTFWGALFGPKGPHKLPQTGHALINLVEFVNPFDLLSRIIKALFG